MPQNATDDAPEPLAILRDYELLSRLGQGGMGSVYLARHSHLDKRVAIKLLPREHLRNPEMVARFKREMKAVGKLQHPNIIQAFDGGEEKGIHFLVLEYAEGLDLNVLLSRYGKLPISDACEIIRQAAVGLEHAHLHGLVHRDIKPANILLAWPSHRAAASTTDSGESDDAVTDEPRETVEWSGSDASSGLDMQPVAKVLDLGLASLNSDQQQSLAQGITGTGQIMGTLDYMAPEQTSDTHSVDIRADIYSLGCTLYTLLAGRPPFYGEKYSNAYQKIVAHNQHSPRPLHEIRENLTPAVIAILNKMLAKNPGDRYATPIEVAAALAPYCTGNTLLATLVEAEARQAEHNSRGDAATQVLNSSAMEGTATGATDEHRYSMSMDDELLELLRAKPIDETIVTQSAKAPETQFQLNVEPTRAVKQVRHVRAQDSRRLRLQVVTAVTCALLGVIIAAVAFRIMTNYGTIEMTLYHKDAQVTVDGDTIRLRPSKDDDRYEIRVAPGRHELQVEKDGYIAFTRDIEIAKGENKPIAITLLRDDHNAASTLPNVASTIRRAEPSKPPAVRRATPDNGFNSTLPDTSRRSVTATFEEPPPLEEWLQDREILTVKQDGTAMFTGIQAALDALKPGQVVEVLDKGPYDEAFRPDTNVPEDVGLVSRVGTQIVMKHWHNSSYEPAPGLFAYSALTITAPNGLRITGFEVLPEGFPPDAWLLRAIKIGGGGDIIVDRCRLLEGSIDRGLLLAPPWSDRLDLVAVHIIIDTNCHCQVASNSFDAGISIQLRSGKTVPAPTIAIENNIIAGTFHGIVVPQLSGRIIVRKNVVRAPSGIEFTTRFKESTADNRSETLIANNTVHSQTTVSVQPMTSTQTEWVPPPKNVRIQNNIFWRCDAALNGWLNINDLERDAPETLKHWTFGHNCYRLVPTTLAELRAESDILLAPEHALSLDPDNPDYLRIPAESPLATAGAGGDLPTYIGAYRPGAAPAEEGWLARLPQRHSPTLGIAEPPPLEEWLKGREILTVKQDGSATFTKIQDALNALKPGQVVEVLDKGPYLEPLSLVTVPAGAGLVSRVGTTIGSPDLVLDEPGLIYGQDTDQFRLEGFDVVASTTPGANLVMLIRCYGSIVQNCTIRDINHTEGSEAGYGVHVLSGGGGRLNTVQQPVVLRRCWFECAVGISDEDVVLAENVIRRSWITSNNGHQIGFGGVAPKIRMVQNIVDCSASQGINFRELGDEAELELINNTFHGSRGMGLCIVQKFVPTGGVKFVNNVVQAVILNPEQQAKTLEWDARGNCVGPSSTTPSSSLLHFPAATNVAVDPQIVSTDASSRDYMRLPNDSPLATAGVGENYPAYIGALPTGPVPAEGDWLLRLQQRWQEAIQPRPVSRADEPLPLDQWLEGREILTVKQDGSAMFTKIQDALDKAKPGRVVKILDRGPYLERLNLDGIGDGGLISTAKTVIEPPDYEETKLNAEPLLVAHRAGQDCGGMRIAGFDFLFHEERLTRGLHINDGCVVEECVFRFSTPPSREPHHAIAASQSHGRAWRFPFVVRNCVVGGGMLHMSSQFHNGTSIGLFARNLFIGDGGIRGKSLAVSNGFGSVICRDNIFAGKGQNAVVISSHQADRDCNYYFVNNTVLNRGYPAIASYANPCSGVAFENNVFVGPAFYGKGDTPESAFFENWTVRHNWFTDVSRPPDQAFVRQGSSNRTGQLKFLSTDANHRSFLRLAPTSPAATGGAGGDLPSYLGALPPGPAPPEGDWFTRLMERWKEAQEK